VTVEYKVRRFQPGDRVRANSVAREVYGHGQSETDRKRANLRGGTVMSQEPGSTSVVVRDVHGVDLWIFCDCLDLDPFVIQEEA
jgi:hypothetical protein